jgi:hypothetical protein
MADERRRERETWLRVEIAVEHGRPVLDAEMPDPARFRLKPQLQPQRRIADRAGHEQDITGCSRLPSHHAPGRNLAESRDGQDQLRGLDRIATEQPAAEPAGGGGQPLREASEPLGIEPPGAAQPEQKTARPGPLRGEIRQNDRKGL